ncbi:MAG: hypothetical protein MR239_05925 [Clostridiales bacterium]|nr:hypothetical protein [Clostridiales bacterium]MDY4655222.1 hypothetical protein [Eubacteriales bacterium]
MKYCIRCGSTILDEAVICPHCGCAQGTQKREETNGMAIAGFVCSFLIPLLGLIFGAIGLKTANNIGNGRGLSIAAIVISILSISVYFIIILSMMLVL